jgi:tRNA dimethylallyltransferase
MLLSDALSAHRPLVVILGPTAVGKSRVAVEVARHFATEILTADSRQVYRGMDIGTDKPTMEERARVPHRLLDLVDPDQPFNAGRYREAAVLETDRLHAARRLPLVVGGTGLYIRTLVRGLCPAPPADPELRTALLAIGQDRLYAELLRTDPESAALLHPHDRAKVIRAVEVHRLTGEPMSAWHRRHAFSETRFTPLLIGLARPTDQLYRRIEERIDWQLAHGMVEETRALLGRGYGRELGAMKGLGYRQVAGYLAGEYDYAEMVQRFKRDTRHFAKRQMTWFRKEPGITWLPIEHDHALQRTASEVISLIDRFLASLDESTPSGVMQQLRERSA